MIDWIWDPQVAVWVETADRSRFIDTVMVTNVTARFGVGNRPGLSNLPSGPRQPYGKRLMVLPVWAWARGKLYPPVVMQDGHEEWMGFHESSSSPDPYYCRPMGLQEVDVDAISCPTKVFNSAKGRLAAELPLVPYPPRNDLMVFTERDCDTPGMSGPMCSRSAERFKSMNDLDAVAAATPPFERVFEGQWAGRPAAPQRRRLRARRGGEPGIRPERHLPADRLRRSDVESERVHPDRAAQQPRPAVGGLSGPLPDRRADPIRAPPAESPGTAPPDGMNGTLHAPDSTISSSAGSGEGRLRTIASPFAEGTGRVFVKLESCRTPPLPLTSATRPRRRHRR